MIDAGKNRHYISIQDPTETRDSYGEPVLSWSTYHNAWASIEPLKGTEYWLSQQVNAEITSKVTIRYKSGINPKMRIVYGNHTYRILSVVNEYEKNDKMIMMVEETITT